MWLGVARSLWIYRRPGVRHRAMDALYRRFVGPGDLVFDVGAHVGDRVASFRRLGARVVAVEPQPVLARVLRWLHGRDRGVVLERVAIGAAQGEIALQINRRNPTVSTVSADFIAAAQGAPGWEGQRWDATVRVPQRRLDDLIDRHGEPAFIKLDIEGHEAAALEGLSRPVAALSFEFTTMQRGPAVACLERLGELGEYRFNAALGESQQLALPDWVDAAALRAWLLALPPDANSGDIYARRA